LKVQGKFKSIFHIPITLGDKLLAAEYIHKVRERVDRGEGTFDWDLDEVILISTTLLETVVARYYLGVEPSCDEQIFCLSQLEYTPGFLERKLSTYEVAALASATDEAQALVKSFAPTSQRLVWGGEIEPVTAAVRKPVQGPPSSQLAAVIRLRAMAISQSGPHIYTFTQPHSSRVQAHPKRVKLIVHSPNSLQKDTKSTPQTQKRKDPPPLDGPPAKKSKRSTLTVPDPPSKNKRTTTGASVPGKPPTKRSTRRSTRQDRV
jgi:hypothetical protein